MKRKTQENNKSELKKFSSEFKQKNKIEGRDTKMIKKESGITLIALVVTIVVLLILAGVSINLVLGNNGIINKSKEAELQTRAGTVADEVELWKADVFLANNTNNTAEDESDMLDRFWENGLITDDDEVDTANKVIKIKKSDGTVVREISYETSAMPNIFDYTEDGFITGIKEDFLTSNPETAQLKDNIKLAALNSDHRMQVSAVAAKFLIKELDGSIVIPKKIKGTKIIGIAPSAFDSIVNLNKVIINADILEIGETAFYHCTGLTSINIPSGLVSIGDYAFYDCDISNITIPSSVLHVGKRVFAYNNITVDVPFEEGQQPSTWNEDWACSVGSGIVAPPVAINYKQPTTK